MFNYVRYFNLPKMFDVTKVLFVLKLKPTPTQIDDCKRLNRRLTMKKKIWLYFIKMLVLEYYPIGFHINKRKCYWTYRYVNIHKLTYDNNTLCTKNKMMKLRIKRQLHLHFAILM